MERDGKGELNSRQKKSRHPHCNSPGQDKRNYRKLMLVDFAQHVEHEQGLTAEESIYQACIIRFRPILMTAMAALLGGVPMMLGSGVGSELRQPLGYAIVGGLAAVAASHTLYNARYLYLPRPAAELAVRNKEASAVRAGQADASRMTEDERSVGACKHAPQCQVTLLNPNLVALQSAPT
jgi:hypothetical protein